MKETEGLSKLTLKVLIFSVIDFIFLILLAWFLTKLGPKTTELKKMKNLLVQAKQIDLDAIQKTLLENKEKSEKLATVLPNEDELIEFINQIDLLKKEKKINSFSFVADKPMKDKTGFFGLPLIIESKGSWQEINETLKSIDQLPYLIRGLNLEIKLLSDKEIMLKFAGILYVSQNFVQD